MSDIKTRQTTDEDQGGEGTRSLHNKGWECMTKDGVPGNTSGGDKKGSKEGTK